MGSGRRLLIRFFAVFRYPRYDIGCCIIRSRPPPGKSYVAYDLCTLAYATMRRGVVVPRGIEFFVVSFYRVN